ncbi:MAG: hypothetical protein ACFCU2_08745 [Acidimicrobiia bacterium]
MIASARENRAREVREGVELQRVGCDEPPVAEPTRESSCDRAEQRPVVIIDGRPVDLAAENGELVAEHDDLEGIGAARPDREPCHCAFGRSTRSMLPTLALLVGHLLDDASQL